MLLLFFSYAGLLLLLFLVLLRTYCIIVLGGWTKLKKADLSFDLPGDNDNAKNRKASLSSRSAIKKEGSNKIVVVVTGGCGMLGSAIVRRLQDRGTFSVVVYDLFPPRSSRRIDGVSYRVANIEDDDLAPSLASIGADIVVHTVGVVDLTSDRAVTHNAHVVGTANVLRASLRSGVRVFVHTSSNAAVTSPYASHSQVDIPANYYPPKDDSFSSYASTKLVSERMALSLHRPPSFRVCALRMPMIYGLEDPILVAPLLSGRLTHVPDTKGVVTEYVYLENAAEAHVKAAEKLLESGEQVDDGVGGRAYNVTNGDAVPQPSLQTWNTLVETANRTSPSEFVKLKPLKTLPLAVVQVLARLSSFSFWIACGHVPFRKHPFWNLTPASLAIACTPVTQNIEETASRLGFRPLYNTRESFVHMLSEGKKKTQ